MHHDHMHHAVNHLNGGVQQTALLKTVVNNEGTIEARTLGGIKGRMVLKGGPVDTGRGFVLHSSDFFIKDATLNIDDGICLTATVDILKAIAQGTDDYSGLRAYQPADSPRHVAWKQVAHSDTMLTKQCTGDASAELWLDWTVLPAALDVEAQLSRLTGWVLAPEASGLRYGLRIPGAELPPGHGDTHRAACLTALALHEAAER